MGAAERLEKRFNDLLGRYGKLEDSEVKRVLAMLDDSRQQIEQTVATTEWSVSRLQELRSAVNAAIARFEGGFAADQQAGLKNIWLAGEDMAGGTLAELGISSSMLHVPTSMLSIAQARNADLIAGLTADLKKKVQQEINLGLMGNKTPYEVMQSLGKTLDDPGVFKSVSARAEAIVRTEMASVHSLAREARNQAVLKANLDVVFLKRWHSSGKARPRPSHAGLDGVVLPLDKLFLGRIPYPHAPGLPASEVVHCGCMHTMEIDTGQVNAYRPAAHYQEQAIYD